MNTFCYQRHRMACVAIATLAVGLVACGGGGGGGTATSTPTAPTATAPTLTLTASATSQAVAGPIVVNSDRALASIDAVSVMAPGGVAVAASATLSADKLSISIAPNTLLSYGTTYAVTVRANANGVVGTLSSNVATPPVAVCAPPAIANAFNNCISPPAATGYSWSTAFKAWVADIGVLVTKPNLLRAACKTIGDACWQASAADGTIKFVNSGITLPRSSGNRPIAFAYYRALTDAGMDTSVVQPFFADAAFVSAAIPTSQSVLDFVSGGLGDTTSTITAVRGLDYGIDRQYSVTRADGTSYISCYNFNNFLGYGWTSAQSFTCPI